MIQRTWKQSSCRRNGCTASTALIAAIAACIFTHNQKKTARRYRRSRLILLDGSDGPTVRACGSGLRRGRPRVLAAAGPLLRRLVSLRVLRGRGRPLRGAVLRFGCRLTVLLVRRARVLAGPLARPVP